MKSGIGAVTVPNSPRNSMMSAKPSPAVGGFVTNVQAKTKLVIVKRNECGLNFLPE